MTNPPAHNRSSYIHEKMAPVHFRWTSLLPAPPWKGLQQPRTTVECTGVECTGEELRLVSSAETDRGCVRDQNQDYFYIDAKERFFIVADGVGGHPGGEVASRLATRTICRTINRSLEQSPLLDDYAIDKLLNASIELAHQAVMTYATLDNRCSCMGTTVVIALRRADSLVVASVGDSRLYHLRGKLLTLVTHDDTLAQDMIDAKMISPCVARTHRARHILTNSISAKKEAPVAKIERIDLQIGDRFMLATDGVNDMLTDAELSTILSNTKRKPSTANSIINEALNQGATDNVTAIVADVF